MAHAGSTKTVPPSDQKKIVTTTYQQAADEESLRSTVDQLNQPSDPPAPEADEHGYRDNSKVPKLPYWKLFWFFFFYNFGLFAWEGPVAQIALIKQRLVVQDQWITLARVSARLCCVPDPAGA